MNGSTSPDASAPDDVARDGQGSPVAQTNGHTHPQKKQPEAATLDSIERKDTDIPDASKEGTAPAPSAPVGDADDAESEAETLIDSPVKKKEAEKQQQQQQQQQQRKQTAIKTESKPLRSRIGGLPVPGEDDEDSAESPMLSTENATPAQKDDDAEMVDEGGDSERDAEGSESEELSSPQSDEDAEGEEDEDMDQADHGKGATNGAESPNPRKRKHRASSASLPNSKRLSTDPPKRRLRGMHSEADALGAEGSASPKLHSHRRAVSTQSALDHTTESGAGRKRKAQFPVKEPKLATGKPGWEESDASSETASRGQPDDVLKRPSRGIGRSTSTPGRPGGREHKRHVNKYGFTKLAEACEEGELDLVKELREKDPDSLELAEFAGNKPLQIASLNGNADVVEYLIEQGCQIDCANVDKDTPLIDAAENGHVEVVRLLLDAGVDPLSQNLKGQQALDVVTDDTDDAPQIRTMLHKAIDTWNSSSARQKRAVEEETRHGTGPSKELHFMARTYDNLLRLVANNDRNGVREFLAARVPVDNSVIAIAAKTGDVYLVNMLLAEMSEKKAGQRAEKPMLAVLGSSHWEMVQALTELETFNPVYRDRQGRNWPTLAEERAGPNWRQERELLQKLWDQQTQNLSRRSSSPVSRRDGGGKRFLRRQNVEGGGSDDDAPAEMRRKNGRRLMSRKDLRAASSKDMSDSSEADEDVDVEGEIDDDVAVEGEGAMGPPDTPNRLRTAGRTRSKSTTSQNLEISPRTRRRSASMREHGSSEKALPVLKETVEESDVKKEEEEQKAEEARLAVEEAQRLAAKQKEADEAEAEAKRVEEAAEAARLQAEHERKAREAEEAEKQRRLEAEEAEQARQKAAAAAEEERQRQLARDKEAAEAREKRKREALAVLPPSLRHVLLPGSDFTYEGLEEKAYLVRSFTPLRTVRSEWVLNLQAAALMGKEAGLGMFLGEGDFAYEEVNAKTDDEVRRAVEDILVDFPTTATADVDMISVEDDDFESELARTAERLNVLAQMRSLFLAPSDDPSTAETSIPRLRLVKLSEARQRLHPLLRDVQLRTHEPPSGSASAQGLAPDIKAALDEDSSPPMDFFASMRKLLAVQSLEGGVAAEHGDLGRTAWTEVAVVHEK